MPTQFRFFAVSLVVSLITSIAAAGPIKVACIGDSITQGNANADWRRNSWPQILQRMLDAHEPGHWTVGNFGRSGATLLKHGSKPWWNEDVHDAAIDFAPDIAIVNLGTNDASPRNAAHFHTFDADLAAMVDMLHGLPSHPAIYLSTLTPMLPPYGNIDESKAPRKHVQAVIQQSAAEGGLPVINFTSPLSGRTDLIPDGIHPTTQGHAIMAAAAFEALTGEAAPNDDTIEPMPIRSMPRPLVRDGRAVAVRDGDWTTDGDVLSGDGVGNRLTATLTPGDGPFHMRTRLRLGNQANSAAAFHYGPNAFGFEGATGRIFRDGPQVGGLRLLHPADVFISPGEWFDFEVIRNGDMMWFLIDGRVVDMAIVPGALESIAFDPMRSTMDISMWSLAGSMDERRPAHWDHRTAQTPWTDLLAQRQPKRHAGVLEVRGTDDRTLKMSDLPMPAILQGRAHAAHVLGDGRVVVAFQDTHEGSPTFGDGVLWCGTLEDLLDRREGQWTSRVAHLDAPIDRAAVSMNGSVLDIAFQEGNEVLATACTMEELEALVPTRGWSIPLADLDHVTDVHVIVDREQGQYLGHPTTVLLEDGRTMLCVYPKGHGKGGIVYKRSTDGGATWSDRLPTPENWMTSREVPTLHRVIDPRDGTRRVIMFSGLYPARMAVSEDDGATWSNLEPVGDWGGIVVMGFVEQLADGRYMAMFHDDGRFFTTAGKGQRPIVFTLYSTFSEDGGMTWSQPNTVWSGSELHLCEPGCIRSPDGTRLAVLLRENSRQRNAHVIFSDDEGATWSTPRELPAALTGDRHTGKYLSDGRLFISFRDTAHESPTKGDWCAWVGTWEDIEQGLPGQYRVRLKNNTHRWDCAYPGVEVLPDGTIVTTTYGHWDEGEQPYIRTVRVTPERLDGLLQSP